MEMPWIRQATYSRGEVISVLTHLAAHHGGHMELRGCPDGKASTQSCFDSHVFEFVEDTAFDMPKDPNHPERGYYWGGPTQNGLDFAMRFKIPDSLAGENVMLQWLYVTSNSCKPVGYDSYFGGNNSLDRQLDSSFWNAAVSPCTDSGAEFMPMASGEMPGLFGEQFVNCAEVEILDGPPTSIAPVETPTDPPVAAPVVPSPTDPVATPTDPPVASPIVPSPTEAPPVTPSGEDSRMIAFIGNWQPCPTNEQIAQYSHIVISFAVSYTWSGGPVCSPTCEIAEPLICNNAPQPALLSQWKAAGKKVILSFGGANMGGSWLAPGNGCWEYCYGRESQVVQQLTSHVTNLGLDGVDIDYEYFYENNQRGSGFAKGTEAQNFIRGITQGLRASLPAASVITHAPMDADVVPGTAYYALMQELAPSDIDYLLPQYYNGITKAHLDGFTGTGQGSVSAFNHYSNLVNTIYSGDATRVVFGFCIADCAGQNSNVDSNQAKRIMIDLSVYFPCNGGAFFWEASDDFGGSWSSDVNTVVQSNNGCSNTRLSPQPTTHPTPSPTPVPTQAPTTKGPTTPSPVASTPIVTSPPTSKSPTKAPTKKPTPAPVPNPTASGTFCCSNNFKDCNVSGWCGESQSHCEDACGASWIQAGSCPGIALWGECTNDPSGCCEPATCQGNQWYKQCI